MKLRLAGIILVSLLIPACSSVPAASTVPAAGAAQASSGTQAGATMGSVSASDVDARKLEDSRRLAEQLQEMQKNSVYFDFDAFSIKPEYREVIRQQAEFMKAHAGVSVTLEGNTDERGSDEYNLALGSLRAKAVHNALDVLGVPDSRIRVVSFGGEKPRLTCHEESCWKENRRVDFRGESNP